jgi:hypothetical protein
VNLDDELLKDLDRAAGRRGRSAYIAELVAEKLDWERRWEAIMGAVGAAPEDGTHPWDGMDSGEWVRQQRQRGSKPPEEWETSS